jgi:dTDP-4-dehydrorhamnose 3,5-epimerase
MRFTETSVIGALLVDLEPLADERGFFARSFCAREFEEHGLTPSFSQSNVSFNQTKGTLRGMHYQVDPAAETKLVRVTRGAIWDVIIDLRPDSPSFLTHFAAELSAENRTALHVPGMCAHGFQTLRDETEVSYLAGDFYRPGHEQGVPHDDPTFAIEWPLPVSVISSKDRDWPAFSVASAPASR